MVLVYMSNNFLKDLRAGKRGETIFLDMLAKHDIICQSNNSKVKSELSKFDFKIGAKTFEIKYDLYEAKSGNVAIEYFNPKLAKASGVNITEADFWVFVLSDGSIWLTRTSILKDYISVLDKVKGFVKNAINCGDGNSCSYIYDRKIIFDNIFIRLDTLNKEELISVFNN